MSTILERLVPRLSESSGSCVVEQGLVTFVNPYSYTQIRRNGHLLSSFDRVGVDGISMVRLLRVCLGLKVERISFDMTSLASLVFTSLAEQGKSVFLVGAREREISVARERLSNAFSHLNIAGYRCGFFADEKARVAAIQRIVDLNPDAVVVGMGTPVQEQFLVDLWHAGWRGAGYTCGGFFHQIAKQLDYYPGWINRMNLRWAYRIWDEPKLARRYGIDYPCAVALFISDAIRYRYQRRNRRGHSS